MPEAILSDLAIDGIAFSRSRSSREKSEIGVNLSYQFASARGSNCKRRNVVANYFRKWSSFPIVPFTQELDDNISQYRY